MQNEWTNDHQWNRNAMWPMGWSCMFHQLHCPECPVINGHHGIITITEWLGHWWNGFINECMNVWMEWMSWWGRPCQAIVRWCRAEGRNTCFSADKGPPRPPNNSQWLNGLPSNEGQSNTTVTANDEGGGPRVSQSQYNGQAKSLKTLTHCHHHHQVEKRKMKNGKSASVKQQQIHPSEKYGLVYIETQTCKRWKREEKFKDWRSNVCKRGWQA